MQTEQGGQGREVWDAGCLAGVFERGEFRFAEASRFGRGLQRDVRHNRRRFADDVAEMIFKICHLCSLGKAAEDSRTPGCWRAVAGAGSFRPVLERGCPLPLFSGWRRILFIPGGEVALGVHGRGANRSPRR